MKRNVFINKLKEQLNIEEEISEQTALNISSIETLSIIAFIDKYFNKQVDPQDLKKILTVSDLIDLIKLEE
jgi:acyl carrier protein